MTKMVMHIFVLERCAIDVYNEKYGTGVLGAREQTMLLRAFTTQ